MDSTVITVITDDLIQRLTIKNDKLLLQLLDAILIILANPFLDAILC